MISEGRLKEYSAYLSSTQDQLSRIRSNIQAEKGVHDFDFDGLGTLVDHLVTATLRCQFAREKVDQFIEKQEKQKMEESIKRRLRDVIDENNLLHGLKTNTLYTIAGQVYCMIETDGDLMILVTVSEKYMREAEFWVEAPWRVVESFLKD